MTNAFGLPSRQTTTWIALVLLMLLAYRPAYGQFDKGQISGFIKDQTGAFIPGVTITVTNEATGQVRTAVSEDNGYYVVTNLPVGYYTVSVELTGFKKFVKSRVKVDAASKIAVDVMLEVGEVSEVVTVEAAATVISSETAQVGRVVERRDVQDLMLNGRNPLFLAMLKAGVRRGAFNAFEPDNLHVTFNINGARFDESLYTIDGVIASRTRAAGAVIGIPNVDAIQEVQILTSNYLPEYGRTSGGQIRFVTRSGGRDFHGDFYEFFRNNVLDANSWARNRSPDPAISKGPAPYRFNQFGYDIGGPIFWPGKFNADRNKLFFFWAQEWMRFRRDQTNIGVVPTLAMRNGDFSELLDPNNPLFGRRIEIIDPLTGRPFPNNVIPQNRLSPNGRGLLNAFPPPTPGFQQGRNNWIGTNPNPRNMRKDTLRVDYHISNQHHLAFSGSLFSWTAVDAFRGTFGLARTDWNRPNRTMSLSLTSALSPTLINEFTFGAAADLVFIEVFRGGNQPFRRSLYGINYPYIFPGTKDIEDKIPTIDISGFSIVDGGPYPAFSSGPIFTWSNNTTKIIGSHTVKWGIFIERSGQNDFDQINVSPTVPGATNNQNGRFEFRDIRPGGTGLAVANAILGLFNNYGEISRKAYTPWRATAFDLFIQDSWKVRPNFTLEYGVRYQYWPPWYSLWNNFASFHPDFYDPRNAATVDPAGGFIVSGDPYNGIALPGSDWPKSALGRVDAANNPEFKRLFRGLPRGFSKTHKDVLAPRLGFAYSLNQKTVLRMGAGMFHSRLTLNDSTLLGGNPPIQTMVGVTNGIVDAPAGATRRDFPFLVTMQDPIFKHPTAWSWNLTIQRELPGKATVEAAYVGRRAYHLQRERNINQLPVGTLMRPENRGINPDALRPFRGLGIIRLSENAAHSWYHGFQLSIDRRFSNGLGFGLAYTLSKITDNASDKRNVLFDAYDDRGYRSLSSLDRTHVFNFHYIYELPFLRDRTTALGKILGGWQISGVTFFQSGEPLSVWRSEDIAGVGPGSGPQPWDLVGNPRIPEGQRKFADSAGDPNFWFNPQAFARPPAGRFGTAGRNILRGPGFQTWDIAIFKNFYMTEDVRIQFRAELFNFPNHPNWSNPDTDPISGTFGKVTSKGGERQIQFGLKFTF